MSGILSTVLILGGLGVAVYLVIHRCDLLHFCDQSASATSPSTSVSDTTSASDNNKKKKCGCCSCTQVDVNNITCDTGAGITSFTNGLSLSAQCDACAKDPNICKQAKAAIIANDAASNLTPKAIGKNALPVTCKTGYHLNKKNTCVPDGSGKTTGGNKDGTAPGCKKGEVYVNCKLGNATTPNVCQCAKANYVRQSYFADTDNFRAFRDRISYN